MYMMPFTDTQTRFPLVTFNSFESVIQIAFYIYAYIEQIKYYRYGWTNRKKTTRSSFYITF